MPRTQGIAIENNFTKGLITESTALNFPRNAATDCDNVIFDEKGRVSRRPGVDYENNYSFTANLPFSDGEAYTEFVWDQVSGLGTISFLVQQQGTILHFYDISSTTNLSPNKISSTIDLEDFLAEGSVINPGSEACEYAQGNGDLIVVNRACDSFYLNYDESSGAITGTIITIKYRDFQGLTPEAAILSDNYRITSSLASLKTSQPNHYYNLLNQGWWQGVITSNNPDSLIQWDAARTDMPANTDILSFYRASATDPFDNARVDVNGPGSALAPKGHFILNLGDADRSQALTDGGFALTTSSTIDLAIETTVGTNIGDFTNTDNAYDGSSSATNYAEKRGTAESALNSNAATTPSGSGYIGRDYGVGKKIVKAEISNSAIMDVTNFEYDAGDFDGIAITEMKLNTDVDVQLYLYGKTTAPSSATDGTLLGTATLRTKSVSNKLVYNRTYTEECGLNAATPDTRVFGTSGTLNIDSAGAKEFDAAHNLAQATTTINSSDVSTSYQYVWVRAVFDGNFDPTLKQGVSPCNEGGIQHDTSSNNIECRIHEITVTERLTVSELPNPDTTSERPTCVEFFAGRAWYAGVQASGLGNNIYFSQVIEDVNQYGRCYQKFDPTSDTFFDILASDGGVIKIAEMGRVIKLFNYQTSLLAVATNGVWIIRGGSGGFSATDFVIRRLSSNGSQSPLSFVDVEGFPLWWGEDGIFILDYNPQFDSFSVRSLTDDTIRGFYRRINPAKRRYVKGCYDFIDNIVYWIYGDEQVQDEYDYNKILAFNLKSKAMFPWTLSVDTPRIKGMAFIEDSIGDTDPKIIFTTVKDIDANNIQITYSDVLSGVYTDWATHNSGTGVSYESHFTTGYMVDGETQKFIQGMYVFFFMEIDDENNSGAFVQGVYEFTSNSDSGKWSTPQQIFNPNLGNRLISQTRRKIRGKGRALQLRVYSEADKPFEIIGWSVNETSNTNI